METEPALLSECARICRHEVLRSTPRHSSVQERDRFAWPQAFGPSRPVSATLGAHTGDGHERCVESTGLWVGLQDLLPDRRALESPHRRAFRGLDLPDRKSTRLNSSHLGISYAVF